MVGTETNPPFALENYQLVEKLPYVIGYFVWTATDNIGEAGVGMPQLRDTGVVNNQRPSNAPAGTRPAGRQGAPAPNFTGPPADMPGIPGANRPSAAAAPGGGFFRRETWPVYTNYQGDIDLIGNRKVPSYYQYVVWRKSKVDIVVNFEVTGNGKVAGVGSGNPRDMSSFQQPGKKAYQGICLAIIRPETTAGKIIVSATAEGLKEASRVITAK